MESRNLDELVAHKIAETVAPPYVPPTEAEVLQLAQEHLASATARYEAIKQRRKKEPCYEGELRKSLTQMRCEWGDEEPRPITMPVLDSDAARNVHLETFYAEQVLPVKWKLLDAPFLRAQNVIGFLLVIWGAVVVRRWLTRTAWPRALQVLEWIASRDLFARLIGRGQYSGVLEQRRLRKVQAQYETLEKLKSSGLITEEDFLRRKSALKTKLTDDTVTGF